MKKSQKFNFDSSVSSQQDGQKIKIMIDLLLDVLKFDHPLIGCAAMWEIIISHCAHMQMPKEEFLKISNDAWEFYEKHRKDFLEALRDMEKLDNES